ncbi:MAG: sugar kinase [Betaproteobacteria bacterium]|nr:MAG: sugar kinase [Betaproteobacteria bacterium]
MSAAGPPQGACLDLVALGEPMIELNQTRGATGEYLQGFGGDTSNCAIAAARLGARSAYVTRVGDDAFGRQFLDLWRREGVDVTGVGTDPDAPTGIYFVSHGANGHEFSYLRAGSAASRMRPGDLPLDVLRAANVLHLSGISQAISASACDSCFAAIDAARGASAKVSYDTNLRLKLWPLPRARAIIRATLALADWALPSLEDAKLLFGRDEPDAILDACHRDGAPLVVLRCGAAGCVVSDGRRRERIAGHRVNAIDATGAGDCFDGAFAARLAAGDDAFAAARYANAAAALATTGYGAVAPLPRHAQVMALLGEPVAL